MVLLGNIVTLGLGLNTLNAKAQDGQVTPRDAMVLHGHSARHVPRYATSLQRLQNTVKQARSVIETRAANVDVPATQLTSILAKIEALEEEVRALMGSSGTSAVPGQTAPGQPAASEGDECDAQNLLSDLAARAGVDVSAQPGAVGTSGSGTAPATAFGQVASTAASGSGSTKGLPTPAVSPQGGLSTAVPDSSTSGANPLVPGALPTSPADSISLGSAQSPQPTPSAAPTGVSQPPTVSQKSESVVSDRLPPVVDSSVSANDNVVTDALATSQPAVSGTTSDEVIRETMETIEVQTTPVDGTIVTTTITKTTTRSSTITITSEQTPSNIPTNLPLLPTDPSGFLTMTKPGGLPKESSDSTASPSTASVPNSPFPPVGPYNFNLTMANTTNHTISSHPLINATAPHVGPTALNGTLFNSTVISDPAALQGTVMPTDSTAGDIANMTASSHVIVKTLPGGTIPASLLSQTPTVEAVPQDTTEDVDSGVHIAVKTPPVTLPTVSLAAVDEPTPRIRPDGNSVSSSEPVATPDVVSAPSKEGEAATQDDSEDVQVVTVVPIPATSSDVAGPDAASAFMTESSEQSPVSANAFSAFTVNKALSGFKTVQTSASEQSTAA